MAKPRVLTRCVANHYAGPRQRIIEYSFPDTDGPMGGLISFVQGKDGTCLVQLYRHDKKVKITISKH